jgi:hypothetical protein
MPKSKCSAVRIITAKHMLIIYDHIGGGDLQKSNKNYSTRKGAQMRASFRKTIRGEVWE